MSILTAIILGAVGGTVAMTALQKAMAKTYARQIHAGTITLDDVKPQTEEYRAYVAMVYKQIYHEDI